MNILKQLFNFYIQSSIHVGLAGVALVWITVLYLNETPSLYLLGFIFFGIISGYNFVKFAGVARLHHRSLTATLQSIQIFSFLCMVAAVYLMLFISPSSLIVVAVCGVLTLFYALPLFPGGTNLRNRSGVKIFLVALTWAGVTVFIPSLHLESEITSDVMLIFMQRFFFILAVALPFEIRDLKYDMLSLGTVPQKIGIQKTKYLGVILLFLFVLLSFMNVGPGSAFFWSELVVALIASILLLISPGRSPYYESFWVEALPILWLIVLWCFLGLMH